MSIKDWKNGEIKTLLSEAWGFKMDLGKLNEVTAPVPDRDDDDEPAALEDYGDFGPPAAMAFEPDAAAPQPTPAAPKPTPAAPKPTTPSNTQSDRMRTPTGVEPSAEQRKKAAIAARRPNWPKPKPPDTGVAAPVQTAELPVDVFAIPTGAYPLPNRMMTDPAELKRSRIAALTDIGGRPDEEMISSDELDRLALPDPDAAPAKPKHRTPDFAANLAKAEREMAQGLGDSEKHGGTGLSVYRGATPEPEEIVSAQGTDDIEVEDPGAIASATPQPVSAPAGTPRQIRKAGKKRAKAARRQGREDAAAAKFAGKETSREESFAAKQAAKAAKFAKRQAARKADSWKHPAAGVVESVDGNLTENKTRNGQLSSLVSEAWGFNMDLSKLNEDFADKHRAAGNTLDEEEGLEEQGRAGLKSKAADAFGELDTQPAPTPAATPTPAPTPAPKTEPAATKPTKAAAFGALDKGLEKKPAGVMGIPGKYMGDEEDLEEQGRASKTIVPETKRTDFKPQGIHHPPSKGGKTATGSALGRYQRSIAGQIAKRQGGSVKKAREQETARTGVVQSQEREDTQANQALLDREESLDEMCGPEHDEAEIVVMGGEDVVGDEAADPAERVAALMDELKDLLMQLAGGGDMEEAPMDEKRARGRRDARHVVGREDDDRKRPGDMSESREEQLREMVRKAIREAMK